MKQTFEKSSLGIVSKNIFHSKEAIKIFFPLSTNKCKAGFSFYILTKMAYYYRLHVEADSIKPDNKQM